MGWGCLNGLESRLWWAWYAHSHVSGLRVGGVGYPVIYTRTHKLLLSLAAFISELSALAWAKGPGMCKHVFFSITSDHNWDWLYF